jgi:hypothetical protein
LENQKKYKLYAHVDEQLSSIKKLVEDIEKRWAKPPW